VCFSETHSVPVLQKEADGDEIELIEENVKETPAKRTAVRKKYVDSDSESEQGKGIHLVHNLNIVLANNA